MDELLALATRISQIGFPTLLVVVILTSKYDIWRWSRDYHTAIADCDKKLIDKDKELERLRVDYDHRIERLEKSVDKWSNVAMAAADTSGKIAEKLKSVT